MSDECGFDPEWWKAAKAASVERKKRAAQAGAMAQPGDTFLIVTEGRVTEPVYFEFLRSAGTRLLNQRKDGT